jgi:hypothetical protein
MRAYLPAYELIVPRTLEEALALLRDEPGVWRPFAGGTDLMVLLEAGKLEHRKFFSIRHLAELRGVGESDGRVRVGALTSYTDVRRSEVLGRHFPMLGQAARETGGIAIQNRGTVGGNIANASPAADTPPLLPQGRDAPRAGHLEGLLRGAGGGRGRRASEGARRARERRAGRAAVPKDRGRVGRAPARRRADGVRGRRAGARDHAD